MARTKGMRFHLLGLPNAPVNLDYCLDGFAIATHRFAHMLHSLGHTVFLYGAEGSNAPCTKFIQVISEQERTSLLGTCSYQHACMDERYPLWQLSNASAAAHIRYHKQPGDFLLTIGGGSQKPIFDFHPELIPVEFSIGYTGNFLPYRVFESYAWMHHCYGMQQNTSVRFFDTVIPMFFDPADFGFFLEKTEDYLLFVGRLIDRKGLGIACRAATEAGMKLKVVGHGGDVSLITGGHEYVGAVDNKTKNELMAKARAVILPTTYIEPFGCAAVEAQMCGTPVISTNCGGFVETVQQGRTGFRCSYLGDFIRAIKMVETLDRDYIRKRAMHKYSMHVLKHDYERYFKKLELLWKDGWYSKDESFAGLSGD